MGVEPGLRGARVEDAPAVAALLSDVGLPHTGLTALMDRFVVAELGGELVGCAGIEGEGTTVLLRSVAVAATSRGRGLARRLCESSLARAANHGAREAYLLTEGAEGYFERLGFRALPRASAPPAIRATDEFSTICPASATLMSATLPLGSGRT